MPLTSTRNQIAKQSAQQRQEDRVVEVPVEAELVDDVVAGETFAGNSETAPIRCASSLGDSSWVGAVPAALRC